MKFVVIVDPYSSATFLPAYFHRLDAKCIAVHTNAPSDSGLSASFNPSDFVASLIYDGDLTKIVDTLRSFEIVAVLPGIETGVLLADQLFAELFQQSQSGITSLVKRDKFLMQQRLREFGLASIRSVCAASMPEASAAVESLGGFPVVLKPLNSGGADGVSLCLNQNELVAACNQTLNQLNFFGINNDKILVQELIQGQEYVVDTVSCEGVHYTVSICRYEKEIINGSFVYKTVEYLPPSGDVASRLIEYNNQCLDALGITLGPSHSEIYLTERGPILVESGARLHGGKSGPLTIEECSENSIFELVAEAYLDPNGFRTRTAKPNSFRKYAKATCFVNRRSGVVVDLTGVEELKRLEGFFDLQLFYKKGQMVTATKDLYSSPGWCVITAETQEKLNAISEEVRQMDVNEKLYRVEEIA